MPTGLRDRLRETTRDRHQELDSLLGELRPFSSVGRYSIYLGGMRELYEQFGEALDRCATHAGLPMRRELLLSALGSDLRSCDKAVADDETIDVAAEKMSEAASWGAAYVLEGSSMGARFLVREAEDKLPKSVTAQFLRLLAGDGSRFRTLCDSLQSVDAGGEEAVAGAECVFRHAINWYRANLPMKEAKIAT